jgi:hypothetical protein
MLQLKEEATLSAMCSPVAGSSSCDLEPGSQNVSLATRNTPSQRLIIGEYSRRCCGRREESSNNGLATHAGSYSHDTDTIRSSLEPVADEPNAGGFEQLMNHTLRLTGKGTKSSAQKTWTAAWWLASAVLQAPPPCVPRLEPMNNR